MSVMGTAKCMLMFVFVGRATAVIAQLAIDVYIWQGIHGFESCLAAKSQFHWQSRYLASQIKAGKYPPITRFLIDDLINRVEKLFAIIEGAEREGSVAYVDCSAVLQPNGIDISLLILGDIVRAGELGGGQRMLKRYRARQLLIDRADLCFNT